MKRLILAAACLGAAVSVRAAQPVQARLSGSTPAGQLMMQIARLEEKLQTRDDDKTDDGRAEKVRLRKELAQDKKMLLALRSIDRASKLTPHEKAVNMAKVLPTVNLFKMKVGDFGFLFLPQNALGGFVVVAIPSKNSVTIRCQYRTESVHPYAIRRSRGLEPGNVGFDRVISGAKYSPPLIVEGIEGAVEQKVDLDGQWRVERLQDGMPVLVRHDPTTKKVEPPKPKPSLRD